MEMVLELGECWECWEDVWCQEKKNNDLMTVNTSLLFKGLKKRDKEQKYL